MDGFAEAPSSETRRLILQSGAWIAPVVFPHGCGFQGAFLSVRSLVFHASTQWQPAFDAG